VTASRRLARMVIIVPLQAARSLPTGSGLAGLLRAPSVLLLAALVMLVAHPWLGVRRLRVEFLAVTSEVVVVALPGRRVLGEFVAGIAHRFEAVFVVSNDVVRDSVARVCQALGVPWYGPTFDS